MHGDHRDHRDRTEQADDTAWVSPEIDLSKPSAARMYDYILGGKDHFAIDRQAADRLIDLVPTVRAMAVANRAFLAGAVQAMARHGVRQFLDLGSGLPTSPNVHELARAIQPDAVVAYVDIDPVVTTHNRARVTCDGGTLGVEADLRSPDDVLAHPHITRLIDFDQPVGLLMVAVLHFIDVDVAPGLVRTYLQHLAPGSMVALTAGQRDGTAPDVVATLEAVYRASPTPFAWRTRAQFEELLHGLDLLEPGVTDLSEAYPELPPSPVRYACAIGRKRPGAGTVP